MKIITKVPGFLSDFTIEIGKENVVDLILEMPLGQQYYILKRLHDKLSTMDNHVLKILMAEL